MTTRQTFGRIQCDYNDHPGIRCSELKLCLESMAHYYAGMKKKQTEDLAFGSLFDEYFPPRWEIRQKFLEKYERYVKPVPEKTMSLKANKQAWEAIEAKGKIPVKAEDYDRLEPMFQALTNKPDDWDEDKEYLPEYILNHPLTEFHSRWWYLDPETNLMRKVEYDAVLVLPKSKIVYPFDVKTDKDASERGFTKSCVQWGYPIQDGDYCRAAEVIWPGYEIKPMTFAVVEKDPLPNGRHMAGAYQIDEVTRIQVREWIDRTMIKICEGKDKGGYLNEKQSYGVSTLVMPWYYLDKFK